jgi:hypothetical protein
LRNYLLLVLFSPPFLGKIQGLGDCVLAFIGNSRRSSTVVVLRRTGTDAAVVHRLCEKRGIEEDGRR